MTWRDDPTRSDTDRYEDAPLPGDALPDDTMSHRPVGNPHGPMAAPPPAPEAMAQPETLRGPDDLPAEPGRRVPPSDLGTPADAGEPGGTLLPPDGFPSADTGARTVDAGNVGTEHAGNGNLGAGGTGNGNVGNGNAGAVGTGRDAGLAADHGITTASTGQAGAGADIWSDLQARFVDDPQSAVHEAAALTERALDAVRDSLHAPETDSTEVLRTAFRRYRQVHQSLSDLADVPTPAPAHRL